MGMITTKAKRRYLIDHSVCAKTSTCLQGKREGSKRLLVPAVTRMPAELPAYEVGLLAS